MAIVIPTDKLDNTKPIREIGQAIIGYEPVRNAFINALINRFAFTIITSKGFIDPWAFMERGTIEYGETIEEIFANLAKVQSFDPEQAPAREFKRTLPDVRTAFHTMNYQKQYPVTISQAQLKQAFLSYGAMTELVDRVVNTLYTAMEYDKFITKKYMLANAICNGELPVVSTSELTTEEQAKANIVNLRSTVEKMGFLNKVYNTAQVYNSDNIDDLFIICPAEKRAYVDVMVNAVAYNLGYTDFLGHVVSVDDLAQHDTARLAELFGADGFTKFSDEQLATLNKINFVLLSRDKMQIYINERDMTEEFIASGKYWNYWLNNWMTFSMSPYAQCAVFASGTNSISGVTVSPDTATLSAGAGMLFTATVSGTGVYDTAVSWSVSGNNSTDTKFENNQLIVGRDETATELTVTATAADGQTGIALITIQ